MITAVMVLYWSVTGAVLSSFLACLPGLHIYNVIGLLLLGLQMLAGAGHAPAPEFIVPLLTGMIVGYSVLNTIPSILLAAPDESAFFTVLPGQKLLRDGRGMEGIWITTTGSLVGLAVLAPGLAVFGPGVLPVVRQATRAHMHWILWCVIFFMLMSEWPKGGHTGRRRWRRLRQGWQAPGMGLVTFMLSGLLGFLLFYRSPLEVKASFQNLMPAFIGLFAVPYLVLNIVNGFEVPEQLRRPGFMLDMRTVLQGSLAGVLGGSFAAFFPGVTGGVGGFLAGHTVSVNQDRTFLVSQGASKAVYYVGAFMFLFIPGSGGMTRGGAALMLESQYTPAGYTDFFMALASLCLAGATSFIMVRPLASAVLGIVEKCGYRRISWPVLAGMTALTFLMAGWMGLLVMVTAAGIGLLPVLFGARRMNCLGLVLLPLACNLSGFGGEVAAALRLL